MAKEGVDLNETNNLNECKSKALVIRHNDKLTSKKDGKKNLKENLKENQWKRSKVLNLI